MPKTAELVRARSRNQWIAGFNLTHCQQGNSLASRSVQIATVVKINGGPIQRIRVKDKITVIAKTQG